MQRKALTFASVIGWLSVGFLACALPIACAGARAPAEAMPGTVDWSQVLVVSHLGGPTYYDRRSWRQISDPEFHISSGGFSEGLCVARREPRGKAGFIDAAGQVVIPFRYDEAWGFNSARATVSVEGKSGVIDKAGRWVIEPGKYADLGVFHEGLCACKLRAEGAGHWGFVDPQGKPVIDFVYERFLAHPLYFQEDRCLTKTPGGDIVYIDRQGRVRARLANPDWEAWPFSEGLARVNMAADAGSQAEKNGPHVPLAPLLPRFGFIDPEGRVVIEPRFTSAGDFTEGLAPASLTDQGLLQPGGEYFEDESQPESERRWGFIDKSGCWAIPMIFERVRHFHNGLAPFRKDGKWGYLRHDGTGLVPPRFDDAREFSRGVGMVIVDGKIAFIDTSGKIVVRTGVQYVAF